MNVDISLPRGGTMAKGRVIGRKRDHLGNPIGRAADNPVLDTRTYEVEWDDGGVDELTANLIAESMYAQCDPEGNQYLLLDCFVDHRKTDKAVAFRDQMTTGPNGRAYQKRSTAGWQLCCRWKDGSTSWERLADLKEAYPVIAAEYAVIQNIDHEPAFNWWAPHVLRKREAIISLVKKRKTRFLRKSHKFGIELPTSVADALRIDKKNGNTFWADSIAKEMKNV